MTAIKLKNIITKRISKIDDIEILNSINQILESEHNSEDVYKLNEVQRNKIKISQLQFKEGKKFSNEKVFESAEKCLKEKSN